MQPVLPKLLRPSHSSHLTTDVRQAERGTGTNGCGTSLPLQMASFSAMGPKPILLMIFRTSL